MQIFFKKIILGLKIFFEIFFEIFEMGMRETFISYTPHVFGGVGSLPWAIAWVFPIAEFNLEIKFSSNL
jgi:hypothetical protein